MLIQKDKTNWLYVLTIIIFAAAASGAILFSQNSWLSKDLVPAELLVARASIPLPTEINRNFLAQVNECFIPTAAVYGYTIRIVSGFRTIEEQNTLFDQGRTEDGHIVTWAQAEKSIHNYGFAVDVVDRWKGYNINWKKLGKIGSFCGLEQVDDPHFEHRGGLATEQFVAGMRPQPLTLPCKLMNERAIENKPLTLEDLKNCGAPDF